MPPEQFHMQPFFLVREVLRWFQLSHQDCTRSIRIKLYSVCLTVCMYYKKKSTKPLPDIICHIGASEASN